VIHTLQSCIAARKLYAWGDARTYCWKHDLRQICFSRIILPCMVYKNFC